MKYIAYLASLVFFLSICISCSDDTATGDPVMPEFTIFPGQGINNLKIGDLGSKVESELGGGYVPIINVGDSGNASYNYFNDSKGVDIVFGQHGSGDLNIDILPIKSFQLFGGFDGMTEEGVKIGSTMAEVIDVYGEPDEVELWANVYYIGMIISYDDMNKVRDITILEI